MNAGHVAHAIQQTRSPMDIALDSYKINREKMEGLTESKPGL